MREFVVPVQFSEAIPHHVCAQFKLIRLPQWLLDMGEAEVFDAAHAQSDRLKGLCTSCRYPMRQVEEILFVCTRELCSNFGKQTIVTPLRGVVAVLTFPESVRWSDRKAGIDFVDWCLIVLDRRYGETVLKEVRRLAGAICETARVRML